jgi:peroxiredoxin
MTTPSGRMAQAAFVLVAIGAMGVFASSAKDGETRRAPDNLVRYLNPSYTGENRTAPDFDLTDRTGRHVRLSDYRGKTVVLHFWTRTCGPCVEELQTTIPAFDEMVKDRRDIALLMVTVDADWNAIAPLVPRDFHAPILFDPRRQVVTAKYGTRLFPETWVIDRDGVIRARFDHTIEWDSPLFIDYLATLR